MGTLYRSGMAWRAAAVAWARYLQPESYFRSAHALSFAVNDVAMVFFFAVVTGEIIEAARRGGALESWKHAALPVVGALGGVGGSALAYVLRTGDEASVLMRGWPIPCAADLTFGYFIARTICRQHPAFPFFLLLGITSDILGLAIVELRFPALDGRPAGACLPSNSTRCSVPPSTSFNSPDASGAWKGQVNHENRSTGSRQRCRPRAHGMPDGGNQSPLH